VGQVDLLIVGASARAAAFSALRAGLRPWCADLFADADLQQACATVRLPRRAYPQGLLPLFAQAPEAPWIYTGALENRPALVGKLAQARPLWGNGPAVLRRVRQPWQVESVLREAGFPCPRTWPRGSPPPRRGRWLVKPLAGAGGLGITRWQAGRGLVAGAKVYLQEFIEGEPCSAVYVGAAGRSVLLGVTRQLIGQPWLFAAPFQYCGSIGPLLLANDTTGRFAALGEVCAAAFALRGLFGIDCILRDGIPYPVEINPRYTASVEVLERALGFRALALHQQPILAPGRPPPNRSPTGQAAVAGKAILFAVNTVTVPARGPWSSAIDRSGSEPPDFGDIPHSGQSVDKGQPVMTLFARAGSGTACVDALLSAAGNVNRLLLASPG
jgi:predicted ATP-grasp superfamily ATP-dependent carboligase